MQPGEVLSFYLTCNKFQGLHSMLSVKCRAEFSAGFWGVGRFSVSVPRTGCRFSYIYLPFSGSCVPPLQFCGKMICDRFEVSFACLSVI
jgi:hypothetical protein